MLCCVVIADSNTANVPSSGFYHVHRELNHEISEHDHLDTPCCLRGAPVERAALAAPARQRAPEPDCYKGIFVSTKIPASHIRIKRAYDPPSNDDGARVLIDRLWPRGIKKESLAVDQWAKELAPSTKLRQWFGHDAARWQEFHQRYAAELRPHAESVDTLRTLARKGTVTLVYAAHDETHNNAVALREFLLAPELISASP